MIIELIPKRQRKVLILIKVILIQSKKSIMTRVEIINYQVREFFIKNYI